MIKLQRVYVTNNSEPEVERFYQFLQANHIDIKR